MSSSNQAETGSLPAKSNLAYIDGSIQVIILLKATLSGSENQAQPARLQTKHFRPSTRSREKNLKKCPSAIVLISLHPYTDFI
jgi:hypothetical protein